MKPNIPFLQSVKAGKVKKVRGYSQRKGGYTDFVGGEATYRKHLTAGYVKPAGEPSLGLPAVVQLTEKGLETLKGT